MATTFDDAFSASIKASGAETTTITLKLEPLAVPKELLGFPCESSAANKIPPNTFYGKLSRPCVADLPGLHSSDTTFSNKTVEEVVLKVLSGNFTLEWMRIKPPEAYDTTEQMNIINAVLATKGISTKEFIEGGSKKILTGIAGTQFSCNEKLLAGRYFSKIEVLDCQEEAMGRRILHLFLRMHGASIEDYVLDQLQIKLHEEYVELQWWKEALDLSIICADVAIANQRGSCHVVKSLLLVGECLEATKSYAKASRLYQEVATTFWDSTAHSYIHLGGLYNCAALASKRAGNYITSEALYLKALHFDLAEANQSWDNVVPVLVNNVLCMYLEGHKKQVDGITKVPKIDFEEFVVVAGLLALLLVGQVKTTTISLEKSLENLCYFTNNTSAKGKQMIFHILSPEFATKKHSRKALTEAVANPENVSHFRSTIVQCCNKCTFNGYEIGGSVYEVGSSLPKQKGQPRDLKKEAKSHAREYLMETGGSGQALFGHSSTCPICGVLTASDSFKFCPCKTIKYCSKACQVTDWKRHKTECSFHKATQKVEANK